MSAAFHHDHDNRPKYNAGNVAELAGAGIADECLNDMLQVDNQGARMTILYEAILSLCELKRHQRAVGGFAVYLATFVELGLANLQRESK